MDLLPLALHPATQHSPKTKVTLGALPKYLLVDGVFGSEIAENMGNVLGKLSSWNLENTFFVCYGVCSNQNETKLQ